MARTLPDDTDLWTAQDRLYAYQQYQRTPTAEPPVWPFPPLTPEELRDLTEEAEAELTEEEDEDGDAS